MIVYDENEESNENDEFAAGWDLSDLFTEDDLQNNSFGPLDEEEITKVECNHVVSETPIWGRKICKHCGKDLD